jgi:DNA-binding transcriptional regulator LsrR (DeoR family)
LQNVDQQRLMTKVARLYHTHGYRQTDIAERLQISQSRVSRLLTQAEEAAIVRIVVAPPRHVYGELEEMIESRYGLSEVHVIEALGADEAELNRDLASAMASIFHELALEVDTIGFTSWSRTLRQMVDGLQPLRTRAEHVVEMLGDLGPPDLQHGAARSTQRLAKLTGCQPVFLRIPGVVPSPEVKDALLNQDLYARRALAMLDDVDFAFVGIGPAEVVPPLRSGENFFTQKQLDKMRRKGAVGQVCLRFLDADGSPIPTPLDDLVIGATTEQIKAARRRWAVAGGPRKYAAIRAAVIGGWVDSLVTDTGTAEYLVADRASRKRRPARSSRTTGLLKRGQSHGVPK